MGVANSGFTLIEITIALLLIGVLAAIAIPQFILLRKEAEKSTVQATISNLKSALYIYSANKFVHGQAPETHNPFDDLSTFPVNYNGVQVPITPLNTPVSTWSFESERNWLVYHPKSAIDGGWERDNANFIVYQVEVITEYNDTVGMSISQYPFYTYSWK